MRQSIKVCPRNRHSRRDGAGGSHYLFRHSGEQHCLHDDAHQTVWRQPAVDFSVDDLQSPTDEALQDTAALKAALKEAKSHYRVQKKHATENEEVSV